MTSLAVEQEILEGIQVGTAESQGSGILQTSFAAEVFTEEAGKLAMILSAGSLDYRIHQICW
jgi:hypothetical protein